MYRVLFGSSVELQCPRSDWRSWENLDTSVGNSSPRYMRENHYAILVFTYEISQVSTLQDKHNAS